MKKLPKTGIAGFGLAVVMGCASTIQTVVKHGDHLECVEEHKAPLGESSRKVLATVPLPQYRSGHDPHSVTHNENEQERYEVAIVYCDDAFRRRNNSEKLPPRTGAGLEKTDIRELQEYHKKKVEGDVAVAVNGASEARADADKEGYQADKVSAEARALAAARPNGNGGAANINNPAIQQGPAQSGTPVIYFGYGPGYGSHWVKEQVEHKHLGEDVLSGLRGYLPSLKDGAKGTFSGYSVQKVGTVEFEECKLKDGTGLNDVVEGLKKHNLDDAVLVLFGSADSKAAAKCPSGTNDYLSAHRAGSLMVELEKRLGSGIHEAHVDIIAGGDAENRRAVDIYLLEKKKMERILDPF